MKCSWQRRNARQTEKDTGAGRTDKKGEKERKREKETETDKREGVKGRVGGAYAG